MRYRDCPVGALEIARMFGVKPNTVCQWERRGILPAHIPGIQVSGRRAWSLSHIAAWAIRTGRVVVADPYLPE